MESNNNYSNALEGEKMENIATTFRDLHEKLERRAKEELYEIANKNLNDWKMSRLGLTDQAILCLGLYELLYTDTPDVVAINEAVELAKSYSDDKVKNMINGVLDKVYHEKIV